MTTDKTEVMLIGPLKPVIVNGLDAICTVHKVAAAKDLTPLSPAIRTCAPSLAATRHAKFPAT